MNQILALIRGLPGSGVNHSWRICAIYTNHLAPQRSDFTLTTSTNSRAAATILAREFCLKQPLAFRKLYYLGTTKLLRSTQS